MDWHKGMTDNESNFSRIGSRIRKVFTNRSLLILTASVAVLFAVMFLAPILLIIVRRMFWLDWTKLSEIGQSYTGIAAVLSAAALIGAVFTVRLQLRQSQVIQEQAVRGTQFQLLSLALEDPALMAVWSVKVPDSSDETLKRQYVYLTMILRHLQFVFITRDMSKATLTEMLQVEFFDSPSGQAHWFRIRSYWIADAHGKREKVFVETAEELWQAQCPPGDD